MSRRFWVNLHLYLAAFLSPVVILMALSGGLYLFDIKGSTAKTPVDIPAGIRIDLESPSLDAEVYTALRQAGINHDFEYVRQSGSTLITRPTSRAFYELRVDKKKVTITRHDPDLVKSMVELHKGHGPMLFRDFQKALAVGLIIVLVSGMVLGLTSAGLRLPTLGMAAGGIAAFVVTAFTLI